MTWKNFTLCSYGLTRQKKMISETHQWFKYDSQPSFCSFSALVKTSSLMSSIYCCILHMTCAKAIRFALFTNIKGVREKLTLPEDLHRQTLTSSQPTDLHLLHYWLQLLQLEHLAASASSIQKIITQFLRETS